MAARESGDNERKGFLFQHLVAMFATLALQQMGKLVNPLTGAAERDLPQARITIEMLEMIRSKTAGNLSPEERRHIDAAIMELQMNYVDESARGGESAPAAGAGPASTGDDRPNGAKHDDAENDTG